MSMSPDDPLLQSLLGPNGSLSGGMNSPLMGLAMGLLQAGGPSRMPTSFGQALGQGMQTGQQFQSTGLQNAMQQLMLGRQKAYVNALMQGPNGTNPPAPNQTTPESDVGNYPGSILPVVTQTPSSNTPTLNANDAASIGAPIDSPLLQDPQIANSLWYAKMAAIGGDSKGQDSWTNQARLRYDMLSNSPDYQGQIAAAKAKATLPEDVISSAMRYGLQPKTRSPTESIYNPVSDPNNPLGSIFQQIMNGQGFNSPQSSPSGTSNGPPSVAPAGFSPAPRNGGIIPAVMTPQDVATQTAFGKENVDQSTNLDTAATNAQSTNVRYQDMLSELSQFTPNALSSTNAKIGSVLNAIDPSHKYDADYLGNIQAFVKNAGQSVLSQAKTMGSRIAAQEVQMIGNWNVNQDMAGNAPRAIINFGQGLNDWTIAKNQAFASWMAKNPSSNYQQFSARFSQVADPAVYALNRMTDPKTNQLTPEGQLLLKQLTPNKQALQALQNRWNLMKQYGWADIGPQ